MTKTCAWFFLPFFHVLFAVAVAIRVKEKQLSGKSCVLFIMQKILTVKDIVKKGKNQINMYLFKKVFFLFTIFRTQPQSN